MNSSINNIIYYTGVVTILNYTKKCINKIIPKIIKTKINNKICNISYEFGISTLIIAGNSLKIFDNLKKIFKKDIKIEELKEIKGNNYCLKFKNYVINDINYIKIINSNDNIDNNKENNNQEELLNIVNPFLSMSLFYNNKEYEILDNMKKFMIKDNEFTNEFFIWFMKNFYSIIIDDTFKLNIIERKNFEIKTYSGIFSLKI